MKTWRLGRFLLCSLIAMLLPAQERHGLIASVTGSNGTAVFPLETPSFYLMPGESLHPSVGPAFELEARGEIVILAAGIYEFRAPGAEIEISSHDALKTPLNLAPGQHPFTLRYRRIEPEAVLRVEWRSERFGWEPVPTRSLLREELPESAALPLALRELVHEYGCLNCHRAPPPNAGARQAPLLTGVGSRVKAEWLVHFLNDPPAHHSPSRMPVLLTEEGRRDVAAYLTTLTSGSGTPAIPAPGTLDRNNGRTLFSTIGCQACHASLPLRGLGSKYRYPALAAFLLNPAIREPEGRMPNLLLTPEESSQIASYLLEEREPEWEAAGVTGDADRGRRLLATSGCLACHSLEGAMNLAVAPGWGSLDPLRGCLADSPPQTAPRYAFAEPEREALRDYLRDTQKIPDAAPAPLHEAENQVRRMRCAACHEWQAAPPTGPLAEAVPVLTAIGEKLETGWLRGVLTERNRVHRWLESRMPHYQPAQVETMPEMFARLEGLAPGSGPKGPEPTQQLMAEGHGMLGSNPVWGGLGCVGCHGWGKYPALGENGPDLQGAAGRLRWDWYDRWMRAPARILSGTSMPNYFGSTPEPQASRKLAALWAALSPAAAGRTPEGYQSSVSGAGEERPQPKDAPIVVRWDMPGATPAAIAVGFPERISYVFDGGAARLLYAWTGDFLDMSGTLLRKADKATRLTPTAEILGDLFYVETDFIIRVGDRDSIPNRRFHGYSLREGAPEFRYQAGEVEILEWITAVDGGPGLRRRFTIKGATDRVWIQVPTGKGYRVQVPGFDASGGWVSVPPSATKTLDWLVSPEPQP